MARSLIRQVVSLVAVSGLLLGCVEGQSPFGAAKPGGTDASAQAKASRSGNRDIEAPEVFQETETGLWDGRPSLGGVWVASPDTKDPERVIMRNAATGKSVVGALFRRERDNPGPKFQISSDAAEALGLLAGQPAEISVIALRREEPAEPEPEPVVPAVAGPAAVDSAVVASPLDTAAIATAALDEVDGKPAAPGTDATAVPAATEPVVKETRKTRREKASEAKAAADAAAAGTPLDATSGAMDLAATAPPVVEKPKTRKEKRAEAEAAKRAEAATIVPLAPIEATALPAAETAAPAAPARPIQIGFFSEEANATRAVAALEKAGVPATARREESNGKVYWTVTARGDGAVLKKAKAAGFADAYFLK